MTTGTSPLRGDFIHALDGGGARRTRDSRAAAGQAGGGIYLAGLVLCLTMGWHDPAMARPTASSAGNGTSAF